MESSIDIVIVVIMNHHDPHPVVVVLSCKAAHSL